MTSESDATNVNGGALFDSLDLQVSKGRTAVEAAGEAMWIAEVEHEMGVLSRQSRDDRIEFVNEWLAKKVQGSANLDLYKLVARTYAGFIKERVSFDPGHDPVAMAQSAWHEWRMALRG